MAQHSFTFNPTPEPNPDQPFDGQPTPRARRARSPRQQRRLQTAKSPVPPIEPPRLHQPTAFQAAVASAGTGAPAPLAGSAPPPSPVYTPRNTAMPPAPNTTGSPGPSAATQPTTAAPDSPEETEANEDDDLDGEDRLEVMVGRTRERVDALNSRVDGLQTQLRHHGNSVGAHESELQTVRRECSDVRLRQDKLDKRMRHLYWQNEVLLARLRTLRSASKIHEMLLESIVLGYQYDPEKLGARQQDQQQAEQDLDYITEQARQNGVEVAE